MDESQVSVSFVSCPSNSAKFAIPEEENGPYIIPSTSLRSDLSIFLSSLLNLEANPSFFDFRLNGDLLRTSIKEHLESTGKTSEMTLNIEYFLMWQPNPPEQIMDDNGAIVDLRQYTYLGVTRLLILYSRGKIYVCGNGGDAAHETSHPIGPADISTEKREVLVDTDTPVAILLQSDADANQGRVGVVSACGKIFGFDPLTSTHAEEVCRVSLQNAITCAAIDDGGTIIAVGTSEGEIGITKPKIDLFKTPQPSTESRKRLRDAKKDATPLLEFAHVLVNAHNGGVSTLAMRLQSSSRYFALFSSGIDAAIRVWDYLDGQKLQGFETASAVTSMDVVCYEGGFRICSGHVDGRVRIWKLQTLDEKALLTASYAPHNRLVNKVCWTTRGMVLSASNDQRVSVVDASVRKIPLCLQTMPAHERRRPELPTFPTSAVWWSDRQILVGTSHGVLMKFSFSPITV